MGSQKQENIAFLNQQIESLTKSGTWEVDLIENTTSWSDGVFAMLGYDPQEFEVTFEKGVSVIHPDDRERSVALFEKVLAGDSEYFIEKRLLNKQGKIVHVRSKANLFKDKNGNPTKLIGVFQNITDFVESQNKQKDQFTFIRNLLANLPSIFFLFNQKKEILEWNKQLEYVSGYSHSEISRMSPKDFFEGIEVDRVQEKIQKVFETGRAELQTWLTSKEGQKQPLFFTAALINYEGQPCVFGVGTDNSEQLSLLNELELLISNTEEAFMYFDTELRIVSFNLQMKSHAELLFNTSIEKDGFLFDHLPEKPKEKLKMIFLKVRDGEKVTEIIQVDGKNQFYEVRFKPVYSGEKTLEGVFVTSLNVTEKLKAEEQLKSSESRFKALVQQGGDLIAILDLEGNYKYVSPTSSNILGIAPEEFIGKNAFDFVHPDDTDWVMEEFGKLAEEKQIELPAFRFKNDKGEWRWLESKISNLLEEPSVQGIVANSRDVTDQIHEKQQLKLLESVVINTNDSVFITEAEPLDYPGPGIIYANEAFTKMTGYKVSEITGKAPSFLGGINSENAGLEQLLEYLRKENAPVDTSIKLQLSEGNLWVNLVVNPITDELGKISHFVVILRDIDDEKRKQIESKFISEISSSFTLSQNLEQAAQNLCKTVGLHLGAAWVELQSINIRKTDMQFIGSFKTEDISKTELSHLNIDNLARKVWTSKKQIVIDDLANKENQKLEKEIGLRSLIGIPLVFNTEVLGIMMLGFNKSSDIIHSQQKLFKRLESFLGSELHRKKLENDLNHLFDAIPEIVSVMDSSGKFLKINQSGSKLLGYQENEILDQSIFDFLHQEDIGITQHELKQHKNRDSVFSFEIRIISKENEIIWLNWFCKSISNEELIYASAKNITAEKNLKKINKQANELAKVGSWEYDLVHDELYWSQEVHDLHETDPNSFKPTIEKAIEFYKEEYKAFVTEQLETAIEEGAPLDYEAIIVSKSKKEKYIRVIASPEYREGTCVKFIGSFQDLSSIKETENMLQAISNNLPGVIYQYVIHPDGSDEIKYVSGAVEQLWGFSREQVMEDVDLIWNQIAAVGSLEEVKSSIAQSIAAKSKWSISLKYIKPNGQIRTHLGNGSPTFLADGTVIFNSIVLDITQESQYEQRLKQTASIARIGSWEVSLTRKNENQMYWSPIIYEILELKESYQPSFEKSLALMVGDSEVLFKNRVADLIETGKEFKEELLFKTGSGEEKWISIIGKSEKVNNKIIRVFGSFQDIHTSKMLQLQIKEILTSISDAFFALNEHWNFSYLNEAAERLLKREGQEVIDQNIWSIFPEAKSTELERVLKEVTSQKESKTFEYLHPVNNNWYEVSVYPSEKEGVSVYFQNINRRKNDEEKVQKANERFNLVIEATQDAIWDWDIVNDTFFRSKNIQNFFGESAPTEISSNQFWNDQFHPKDKVKIRKSLDKALANPNINRWELEYKIYNDRQEIVNVIDRGLIIRRKDGKPIRMVGAMTNITEQKRLQNELINLNKNLNKYANDLEGSNRELEQFAYVASHDLQEPLRMVTGFLTILQNKYEDHLDEKANEYISHAVEGAKRMRQIILDLLNFSRVGKEKEEIRKVDLNDVMSEVCYLLKNEIDEKDATIQFKDLPIVLGHKAPMIQVFQNLVSNSIKYSKEKERPKVIIKSKELKNEWKISIEDNGIGIDEKHFDKIFNIFHRLHGKSAYSGTGMGLAIVKKVIEGNNGRIWLSSDKGKGSTFYFTLPKSNQ